ncbi:hypothetical protein OS493_014601 [Desmophyllum pertusum]|uniref:Uncharacterized protein n=1 Tax=Desmophyllum pertusum TaxID=174260 RepID=A0A9W9YSQ2_9CNID|nr:hypothetical protein OS493_014601 [Desmophyllum pertusum]
MEKVILSVVKSYVRLYEVFDVVGRSTVGYNPGTKWCNLCKQRADKELQHIEGFQAGLPRPRKIRSLGMLSNLILGLPRGLRAVHGWKDHFYKESKGNLNIESTEREHNPREANRLTMLQQSTSIRGFDVWTSIETQFGTVKINKEGDILLDASIWSKMSEAFNKLNAFEQNSFEKLVADFQLGLFHHYAENKEPVYNPAIMRDFAKENALGLIDTILQSILR